MFVDLKGQMLPTPKSGPLSCQICYSGDSILNLTPLYFSDQASAGAKQDPNINVTFTTSLGHEFEVGQVIFGAEKCLLATIPSLGYVMWIA